MLQGNQKSSTGDHRMNRGHLNVSYMAANTLADLTLCSQKPWLEKTMERSTCKKNNPKSMGHIVPHLSHLTDFTILATTKCKALKFSEFKVL